MADKLIGEIFGNYELKERLGKGGMGYVYRGVHQKGLKDAAVKVLRDEYATDKKAKDRFLGEAQKAQAIGHVNVIRILDFGLHPETEQYYLVMELAEEGSLASLLNNQNSAKLPWSLSLAVDLIGQTAEGIAAAHREGVIHRDLKPANILLQWDRHGVTYIAKVADFGLAKFKDEALTSMGRHHLGTPNYMSPEQWGADDIDKLTDIYSLGVILYEAVAGQLPFSEKPRENHLKTHPPSPRDFNPNIPDNLERIILRCLEKKTKDRFASADEVVLALKRVYQELQSMTIPPPRPNLNETEVTPPVPRPAPPPAPLDWNSPGNLIDPQLIVTDATGFERHRLFLKGKTIIVGQEASCSIRLAADDVSREHLRIEQRGNDVIITDLNSRNGSYLAGIKIKSQQVWDEKQPLNIGPFWLWLSLPQRPSSNSSYSIGPRIGIKLEKQTLLLAPGQSAMVSFTVSNLSHRVQHIKFDIEGVPPDWVLFSHPTLQLHLKDESNVALTVTVPKSGGHSGERRVRLKALDKESIEELGSAETTWTIQVAPEVVVPGKALLRWDVSPEKAVGFRKAAYRVELHNVGNVAMEVLLTCKDEEGKGRFFYGQKGDAAEKQATIKLDANETVMLPVISELPWKWVGGKKTHRLKMRAFWKENSRDEAEQIHFMQRALIPKWLILITIIAFLVFLPIVHESYMPGFRNQHLGDIFLAAVLGALFIGSCIGLLRYYMLNNDARHL